MTIKKIILVGALAMGLSAGAFAMGDDTAPATMPVAASSDFNPGIYIGLQAGYGNSGWTTGSSYIDFYDASGNEYYGTLNQGGKTGFAGRVFAGYDFTKNFALELGYMRMFTKLATDITGTKYGPSGAVLNTGTYHGTTLTQAFDLMGKLTVPFADTFGVYAKLGADYLMSSYGSAFSGSTKNFNVAYGAGLDYFITPNLVTDLSWTRYNGNQKLNSDKYQPFADFFALGISYKFNI